MAHFASGAWNNPSGLVASLDKLANAVRTTDGSTATEGTNKLTYTTVRAGLYRVSSYLRVSTASDAVTTNTAVAQVAYNNGTAITAVSIGAMGTTPGTISLKGTAGTTLARQATVVYAAIGTDIVMTVAETSTGGAPTVGAYDIHFTIEAL